MEELDEAMQDFHWWAVQYLKWSQALCKLEEAMHYIFSPMRMTDMKKLLEACYLRCLVLRNTLVIYHIRQHRNGKCKILASHSGLIDMLLTGFQAPRRRLLPPAGDFKSFLANIGASLRIAIARGQQRIILQVSLFFHSKLCMTGFSTTGDSWWTQL